MRQLTLTPVSSPLKQSFAISRGAKTSAETLQVSISENGYRGRGECVPYARYNETLETVTKQIERLRPKIEAGIDTEELQRTMPPGAARCAVDCALWDLKAKTSSVPVWELAGLEQPKPLETAVTLSLDTPVAMAKAAEKARATLLKLKLGGPEDITRLQAVHARRPDARLILDGNEGISPQQFTSLVTQAAANGALVIEQPFPADDDELLLHRPDQLAICADESVHTSRDLQALSKKYDMVNIKLDKAGGFTEALAMIKIARQCGLGVMIGCMIAGSLSMAPAMILGQLADIIDLDGPLWLKQDIGHGLYYDGATVSPPLTGLWG